MDEADKMLGPADDFLWSRRWAGKKFDEITVWRVPTWRELLITQDYGGSRALLAVNVKEYVPQEGDVQEYKWIDGEVEKSLHLPPFALVNLTATGQDMQQFIDAFGKDYIEDTLDECNPILWQTFGMACKAASIPLVSLI
jgi:hypothetical protein